MDNLIYNGSPLETRIIMGHVIENESNCIYIQPYLRIIQVILKRSSINPLKEQYETLHKLNFNYLLLAITSITATIEFVVEISVAK